MKQSKLANPFRKIMVLAFRLLLILFLLEAGLRISGYARSLYYEQFNKISSNSDTAYRIMVVGDSITYGDGPSWAQQLKQKLNSNSKGMQFEVFIEARPGYTSPTILSKLENNLEIYHPDIVIAMMGANDPYLGNEKNKLALLLMDMRIYKFGNYAWSYFLERLREISSEYTRIDFRKKGRPINLTYQLELGNDYYENQNFAEAEKEFKKILDFEPNDAAYIGLARIYLNSNGPGDALSLYNDYMDKYNNNAMVEPFEDLGWHYLSNEQNGNAEQLFSIIKKINPDMLVRTYTLIGKRYDKAGVGEKSREYFLRASQLRNESSNLVMQSNYQKLYNTLHKRNINLVAVQYPTLSVEELKAMFHGDENIIFVSNEENFKRALGAARYEEIFRDHDHASYGHLTGRGADLVADSVANAILKARG